MRACDGSRRAWVCVHVHTWYMPVRHLSNMDMRWSSSLASRTFVLTSVTDSLHCSPARDKAMKSRQRKQCSFIIQLSAGGRGWSKPITQCPLTPVLPLPAPLTFFSPDFFSRRSSFKLVPILLAPARGCLDPGRLRRNRRAASASTDDRRLRLLRNCARPTLAPGSPPLRAT